MKTVKSAWRVLATVSLVAVLVGCSGGEPQSPVESRPEDAAEAPGGIVTEQEDTQTEPNDESSEEVAFGPPAQFSFAAAGDDDSRRSAFTLTVTDSQGKPVPGASVSLEQTDLDFFFDSAYNPNAAWSEIHNGYWDYWAETPDAEERKQEYAAVGFNTDLGFYSGWWRDFEPNDDDWQSMVGPVTLEWLDGNWTPRRYPSLPGTRFFRVNLGPAFGASAATAASIENIAPDWVDVQNKETFMNEYEEYLREVLSRGEQTLGGYDLIEVGVEINDWDLMPWQTEPNQWPRPEAIWTEWVDMIDWVLGIAAEYNTMGAPVCLHLDIMGWDPAMYPVNLGPQPIIEALIAKDAPFDCLGFEMHPGSYTGEYDTAEFWRGFLDEMETYDKLIYVWEFAVRSEGVPEPAPDWSPTWVPPVEEYTEAYQARVMTDIIRLLMDDPMVIGVALLDYRDVPPEALEEHLAILHYDFRDGLLRGDRTRKPAHEALKDYWHSLFASSEGVTDEQGQVAFKAIPGMFLVTIGGQTASAHLYAENSVFVRGEEPTVIPLPGSP